MYPWEHLVLGYVLFSLYTHVRFRESPTGVESVGVLIGSQLPDLIDKPLAWTFGLVETGYAIGHSILFAPGFCGLAIAISVRVGRLRTGIAFVIAFLSHLASDIVYPIAWGRPADPRVVLWPIAHAPGSARDGGFIERTVFYVQRFVVEMATGELTPFVRFQLVLVGAATLLWIFDGAPVASDMYRCLRRNLSELARVLYDR